MATKMWHYIKYKDILEWKSIRDRENKLADKTTLVLSDKEYKKILESSKKMHELWRKNKSKSKNVYRMRGLPRTEKTHCPICLKPMTQRLFYDKHGKVKADKYSCSKKCQKILDTWKKAKKSV